MSNKPGYLGPRTHRVLCTPCGWRGQRRGDTRDEALAKPCPRCGQQLSRIGSKRG